MMLSHHHAENAKCSRLSIPICPQVARLGAWFSPHHQSGHRRSSAAYQQTSDLALKVAPVTTAMSLHSWARYSGIPRSYTPAQQSFCQCAPAHRFVSFNRVGMEFCDPSKSGLPQYCRSNSNNFFSEFAKWLFLYGHF